ncbi:MAG: DUF2784 family protein [Acidobacteriota bacterium]|nr:DUF2784 family protein [Acidobacteriota bacterium]
MYYFLDKFFFVFHSTWIIFNLFGWMWKKTRLANLITLSLTAFSWFILGIWYGYGFCPSTEWHWQVRIKLGIYDMPSSYLKFLIDSMTGLNISEGAVNIFAFVFLVLAFSVSIMINIKDWKKKHK